MLKEIEFSETPQESIQVKISHVIDPDISYVNYKICLETNDPSFASEISTTCRRYSEFRFLHTLLSKQFPYIKLPSLPPKSPFKKTFDIDFIKKREAALQEYLEQLCLMKICLSNRAFHLFLQSSMTIVEIENTINGEVNSKYFEAKSIVNTFKSFLSGHQPIDGELISNQSASNESSCSEALSTNLISETSSPGSKRVSFCDQVTVAEIHAP